METIREREQELRKQVNESRFEAGLTALLALAKIEQEKALAQWTRASGTDLVKYQSEYNAMQRMIDFMTKAPREFKQPNREGETA